VILQQWPRPLIGVRRLEQPRSALALELHHDVADVRASRAPYNDFATDLVKIRKRYIAGLFKDDGGLHASTAGPRRDNRRLSVVVHHA